MSEMKTILIIICILSLFMQCNAAYIPIQHSYNDIIIDDSKSNDFKDLPFNDTYYVVDKIKWMSSNGNLNTGIIIYNPVISDIKLQEISIFDYYVKNPIIGKTHGCYTTGNMFSEPEWIFDNI